MRLLSYLIVAVPLPSALVGFTVVGLFPTKNRLDDLAAYVNAAALAQVVLFLFLCLVVLQKTALYTYLPLPETPADDLASRLVVPLSEEVVKLALLASCFWLFASREHEFLSYVLVLAAVFAVNKLNCHWVTFSPIGYAIRYRRFCEYFEKYETHDVPVLCGKKSIVSTRSDDSGSTLVLLHSDPLPPLIFNLDPFASPDSTTYPSTQAHQMIDRFYSVSPRDTMYLACEPGMESSSDSDDSESETEPPANTTLEEGLTSESQDAPEPELASESADHTDMGIEETLALAPEWLEHPDQESVHSTDTHFGGGGGGNLRYKFPDGSLLKFGGGAGFDYKHRDRRSGTDSSTANDSWMEWFRWLYPKRCKRTSSRKLQHMESALIKKKFSTYSLGSETKPLLRKSSAISQTTAALYASVDLESQSLFPTRTRCNSHRFFHFAKFANKYLDLWLSDAIGLMSTVDPAFKRFGTIIPRLSVFYFTAYLSSICLWQFTSFHILAYPFLSSAPVWAAWIGGIMFLLVTKLFCANYLHSQCHLSFKVSIAAELLINIAMFVTVVLY